MTTLSHSQLGKERITLYMNPENTEKKDGESEEIIADGVWDELPVSPVTGSEVALGCCCMRADIIPNFRIGSGRPGGGRSKTTGQR